MSTCLTSSELYSIAWICALPIERAAAIATLDKRHQAPENFEQHPSDHNFYSWGAIGEHNIVIASLDAGVIGKVSAATTASQLLASLPHIKFGLLVGIGGGIPNLPSKDIRLGDVAVSQPKGSTGGVVQYDLGKAIADGTWERKGTLNKPPSVLLKALAAIQAEHLLEPTQVPAILKSMVEKYPRLAKEKPGFIHQGAEQDRYFDPGYSHGAGADCTTCDPKRRLPRDARRTTEPHIHYGVIGSGDGVVKDPKVRERISQWVGPECICLEMEAAGLMDQFPCLVIRGISDYADSHKNDCWQQYAAASAAAFAKELLGFVRADREFSGTPRALDAIQSVKQQVASVQEGIDSISDTLNKEKVQKVLSNLGAVTSAAYNSLDETENSLCLPGTRVALLSEIDRWVAEPHVHKRSIFWLDGKAGTGKSTISRTVATRLHESGHLGASFFFKRGEGDRGHDSKLVATLAAQMVPKLPGMAALLNDKIESDPDILHRGLAEQLEELVLKPYSELSSRGSGDVMPTVIMIDALDECRLDSGGRAERLFRLFEDIGKAGLRLFITSRPEIRCRIGFTTIQNQAVMQILHEIPEQIIREDISTFLNVEIRKIRDEYNATHSLFPISSAWPESQQLQQLIDLAVPLFIFAATVCRFLRDESSERPETGLTRFLTQREDYSGLDATYQPVLDRIFPKALGRLRARRAQDFIEIVGTIVTLFTPLSLKATSALLNRDIQSVSHELERLHSVLNIPSDPVRVPIRLFHLSFRDFLVDPGKEAYPDEYPFWVKESSAHQRLTAHCLRLMESMLKRDICNLQIPDSRRSEVTPSVIEECLPPELQYACRYWVFHCKESGRAVRDDGPESHFLSTHFLYWLEALSFQGLMHESLNYVEDLLLLLDPDCSARTSELLMDARRVILEFRSAIDQWPLQLYFSVLLFTPQESIIRQKFSFEGPKEILPPRTDARWAGCLQSLDGHESQVRAIAFSGDSQILATADARLLKLWHVSSGVCTNTIQLPEWSYMVTDGLQFSEESNIVYATTQMGVWLQMITGWDVATGTEMARYRIPLTTATSAPVEEHMISLPFPYDLKQPRFPRFPPILIPGPSLWSLIPGPSLWSTSESSSESSSECSFESSQPGLKTDLSKPSRDVPRTSFRRLKILRELKRPVDSPKFEVPNVLLSSSPCLGLYAIQTREGNVWLRNIKTSNDVFLLRPEFDQIVASRFSEYSKTLLGVTDRGSIELWDVVFGRLIKLWQIPLDHRAINRIRVSKDLTILAVEQVRDVLEDPSQLGETSIKMPEESKKEQDHNAIWPQAEHVTQRKHEAWGSLQFRGTPLQMTCIIWRTETSTRISKLDEVDCTLSPISDDARLLAARAVDGRTGIWDLHTGHRRGSSDLGSIELAVFSHDSKFLASVLQSGTVQIWDTAIVMSDGGGQSLQDQGSTGVLETCLSPDLGYYLVRHADGCLELFDSKSALRIVTLSESAAPAESIRFRAIFSKDSRLLAVKSPSRFSIDIWDCCTGTRKAIFNSPMKLEGQGFFCFSPDSKFLALGAEGNGISSVLAMWDLTSFNRTFTRISKTMRWYTGAFSSDSRFFLFTWDGGHVEKINTATGQMQRLEDSCTEAQLRPIENALLAWSKDPDPLTIPGEDPETAQKEKISYDFDQHWVSWNSTNHVWLPSLYRPVSRGDFQIKGSKLLIKRSTGGYVVLALREEAVWYDAG